MLDLSAFFGKHVAIDLPPYIPAFNSDIMSVQPSLRSYEVPSAPTSREMGIQVKLFACVYPT